MKSKRIAFTAVMTAFSVACLYIASVFPTGQLGFLGITSLFGIAAVIESGYAAGGAVFAASALLGFFLVPNKVAVFIYALFFGYYPIVKALAEKLRSRVAEWAVKLAVMNAAFTVITFIVKAVVISLPFGGNTVIASYIAANVVFVIYDVGVTYLTAFYVNKISRRIRRG